MGCIRIKMTKIIAIMAVSSFCFTACGTAANNCNVEKRSADMTENEPEVVSGKASKGERNSAIGRKGDAKIQKTEEPEGKRIKAGSMEETVPVTSAGVPVYREDDRESVREYLKEMPDGYLSFREAKQLGIIREDHVNNKQKEKEYFGEQWLSFYSNSKESKDILEGKREKDIGTVYEDAVVIVHYTIEGDPIYKYISYSYRDGTFYLYEDASRDRFGCGSSKEEGLHGSYGDIRWLQADGETDGFTDFYLVKSSNITSKKMEKMLDSDEAYDSTVLFQVYRMGYMADTIDGAVICR